MRTWFMCVLAACGGSEASGTPITITFDRTPMLVAVNDGGGWTSPRVTTPDVFTADVHGPYYVASVYRLPSIDTQNIVYQIDARTPDDDPLAVTALPPAQKFVTGMAVQPGSVFVGDGVATSTTADWQISIATTPGTHDLVGLFGDRAVIQRGLDVSRDLDVGTLDATTAGIALDTAAFSATNAAPDEVVTARAVFENATISCAAGTDYVDAKAVHVFPDAALMVGDRQSVSVRAAAGGHARYLRQPYHAGASTAYGLPSLIDGVSVSARAAIGVQWSRLDDGLTSLTGGVEAFLGRGSTIQYQFAATGAFLAATPLAGIEFVTSIPGFDPAWVIDATTPLAFSLEAQRVRDPVIETEILGAAP